MIFGLFRKSAVEELPPVSKTRDQRREEFMSSFEPWRRACLALGANAEYLDMQAETRFEHVELCLETARLTRVLYRTEV